jgi:hypothetical protein
VSVYPKLYILEKQLDIVSGVCTSFKIYIYGLNSLSSCPGTFLSYSKNHIIEVSVIELITLMVILNAIVVNSVY